MTVAELIAKLQEFPPDAEVTRGDADWGVMSIAPETVEQLDGEWTVHGPYHGVSHDAMSPVRIG